MTFERDNTYSDLEKKYVNKGYILTFFHIPTGRKVFFKGLITSLSDNFQSDWNDESVYGRMDPISTFRNTKRTIAITWDVVAANDLEAKENMKKISLLLSMLYPVYSGGNVSSITTAPLFKIGFANLIQDVNDGVGGESSGVVARVDGFNFTPNMDEQFFDVDTNILYPQSLTISANLTVFHMHPLGWNSAKNPRKDGFPYGEFMGEIAGHENVNTTTGGSLDGTFEQQAAQQNIVLGKIM